MKLVEIAARNIRRNRRRSVLSASATAVAAMTIMLLFALVAGIKTDYFKNLYQYFTGQVRVKHEEYDKNENVNPLHLNITDATAITREMEQLDLVTEVSPRISFPSSIYIDEELNPAIGMGLDFSTEGDFMELDKMLVKGRYPKAGEMEAVMGAVLADKLGLGVGDKFTVLAQTSRQYQNAVTLKITGLVQFRIASMNSTHYFIPLDRAQRLLMMPDAVTEILLQTGTNKNIPAIIEEANAILQAHDQEMISAKDYKKVNTLVVFIDMIDIIYGFMGIIFLALASTVLINTTMMVIFERMREIGTIAAMGMTGKEIVRLFLLEAGFLGVLGSLAGVMLGSAIGLILEKTGINFSEAMQGIELGMSEIWYTDVKFTTVIFTFCYSVVVSTAAAYLPSRRAAKIEPVEALRAV